MNNNKRYSIYTVYAEKDDMTFIMRDTYVDDVDGDGALSSYYGQPSA